MEKLIDKLEFFFFHLQREKHVFCFVTQKLSTGPIFKILSQSASSIDNFIFNLNLCEAI